MESLSGVYRWYQRGTGTMSELFNDIIHRCSNWRVYVFRRLHTSCPCSRSRSRDARSIFTRRYGMIPSAAREFIYFYKERSCE